MTKPTIPEVIDRFRDYYADNPTWGSLHIVLDDENVADSDVDFCIDWARMWKDDEGLALGLILRQMSRTQRLRISQLV